MNEIVETTKRRCKGRESALTPDRVAVIRQGLAGGERKAALARKLKISRQTLGTHLNAGNQSRAITQSRHQEMVTVNG
jgi:DNA invertase Pin-like site-specific DNA recombinase